MYPGAPYLAQQTNTMLVQHSRTSGEVEWALIIADDGASCSRSPSTTPTATSRWPDPLVEERRPDVLGSHAWVLSEIIDDLDQITLRPWVTDGRRGRGD